MSGFLALTAVLSALCRRARTGIGADVRKDMAMPFKNVVYTQTDKDTHTQCSKSHWYSESKAWCLQARGGAREGDEHSGKGQRHSCK